MKNKRTHIEITAPLMEMESASDLGGIVTVDPNVIAEITDGDPTPQYVISEIKECQSDKKITYDYDAFQIIAEQVNSKQPTGYLGHIKDADKDTALPEPQVLWLGSKAIRESDGKSRLITKGYLIPEGKARGWIKRKVVNSVSWYGDAILTPSRSGGYKLQEFFLESIDFSRKNREGLKNQRLQLVTEMEVDNPEKGKQRMDGEKDYGELVATLNFHELNTHNAALVTTIKEMAKSEVKEETAAAVKAKEDELNTAHKTEIEALPEKSIVQKLMAIFKLEDMEKLEDQVVALLEQLDTAGKKAIEAWFKSDILEKKVPNEKARALVGRLIPVSEMEGDWRTESGQEKIKTALEDRVDDALENDDDIKVVIQEMGAGRGGVRLAEMRGSQREHRNNDPDDSDAENIAKRSGGRLKAESVALG